LISVEINGDRRDIPPGLNVRQLLTYLGIDSQRVAIELNRQIVRKADWDHVNIELDAQIEVVMFVGGGSC